MYLYEAVTDVAALTGNDVLAKAADRLWQDVVSRRQYLTGGVGSRGTVEAFGDDYELPNLRAYTETCASVGNDLWNQRMFLLHGDGKYIDRRAADSRLGARATGAERSLSLRRQHR